MATVMSLNRDLSIIIIIFITVLKMDDGFYNKHIATGDIVE